MLDDVEVVVAQHLIFEGVIFSGQKLAVVQRFFFTEIVEDGRVIGWTGVKRTFDRLRRAILVLHVVGEDHQLRDVDEAAKFWVAASRDDAVALGQHTFTVVGLLDLDEGQRHAVDQKGDIRTELVVAVFASQLSDDMEAVVVEVFKVDQSDA